MTYAVDARWTIGGIGRYATEVARYLNPDAVIAPNRMSATSPIGSALVGLEVMVRRISCIFVPGYLPPLGVERRTVPTVHDLMYVRGGAASTGSRATYFDRVVKPQLLRCPIVLTGSEFVRQQILEWLGPKAPPIEVVGYGLTDSLIPGDARVAANRDASTWLFIGGDKMNKNLPRALEAWQRAGLHRRGFRLVVLGTVSDAVRRDTAGVSFAGLVTDDQLAGFYATASFLLMPSLDEGYGLPALEAIACRTPVLFGSVGLLPSVVGACGVGVNPMDVGSIADAMVDMTTMQWATTMDCGAAAARANTWEVVAGRVEQHLLSVSCGARPSVRSDRARTIPASPSSS